MVAPLRLKATDAEDLAVLASFVQDAVVPLSDMMFQQDEALFVLAANRFRWEDAGESHVEGRIYERQRCGLRFERVAAVRVRGLDQNRRGDILSLLTIGTADAGAIELTFAGGGVIRLEVDGILCHLDDFDEPWPTLWRPNHREADADGA
jgi:hypothetical protein